MEQHTAVAEHGAQVKVTFTTTEEDIQLPEGKRQLLVPADIRRYGLSRILNSESMLDTASIPFDFLVNGSFLHTSLEDYLKANGLSIESSITLQYVRSLTPPIYEASFEHDDWVSAVDVLSATSAAGRWSGDSFQRGQDRILSASYDGLLRIWSTSGHVIATSPSGSHGGHTASIKAAKFLSSTQIASAGMDRTVRVWKYSEHSSAAGDHVSGDLKPTLELYGHAGSIDSLEVDGQSKRMLTASADGAVGFWSTSKTTAPEPNATLLPGAHTSKRRKVSSSVTTALRGPLAMMNIHSAPASAAVFDPRDRTVAYSVSQDHTMRTIDLTTSVVVSTLTTSHPLLSLCALARSSSAPLLAAGTSARHVTLVDPRSSATTTSVMTLRGHTNKVVGLAPSPDNEYSLVSASHDATCRLWDLRSVRPATKDEGLGSVSEPVYVIDRESRQGSKKKATAAGDGCKVFGVAWDKLGIFSAGEDKKIQINRGKDVAV
ncbi:WD40-repeat-containing domain protein [Lasiosphaeria miniovina]|uniref:Ribosome biogenesis protein YTM1 n=1 Tax=Lasiosphaeria miniovina TaxID=1954250 RepID=A0AA40E6Y5_9PEZI|nr:WD40-repeat-containing domain protein [Lasiosphaeria miniovina]KAK0727297.1 WD40-repeat-containing domain protein [Lasiosphaeria miniovina]